MGGLPIEVLVVEDSAPIRAAWARLLAMQTDMTVAGLLERAQDLKPGFVEHKPDVVLLDLNLGEGDGLGVLGDLLKSEPDARVLVYSGTADQATVDRCVELGAWGFIGKDAEPEDVLDAIRRIARGEAIFPHGRQ